MNAALYKLAAWLSPAYPVGAYTYSHGLEWAIGDGLVVDDATATAWISDCLQHGAGRTDAILLCHAWRAAEAGDDTALDNVAELAAALAPSAERLLETQAQGVAFADVTASAWGDSASKPAPYPVAVGAAAGRAAVPLDPALMLFLQAFVANLVSVAIRLVPLGQAKGQAIIADLMEPCQTVAKTAAAAALDDVGGCALMADIASMRHETQEVRLFRS